jgi:N-acetylglucosaminyldiphosphoundecaprenol N-acetyl-beta-D-mannosaminyltransferase
MYDIPRSVGTASPEQPGIALSPIRGACAWIGQIEIDSVSFEEALARIEELVSRREGGAVFTPNVDHAVKAERDVAFREAYARASLSLADGMPLLWASRLLGTPLPEKISGSDLVVRLARLAARKGWRVPPGWRAGRGARGGKSACA